MTVGDSHALLAVAIFLSVVIFAVCVVILGFGARAWSDSIAAVARARSFLNTAAGEERLQSESLDAVDEAREQRGRAPYVPPTDRSLIEAILAERPSTNGVAHDDEREYTTDGNENIDESPPIPEGGMYKT